MSASSRDPASLAPVLALPEPALADKCPSRSATANDEISEIARSLHSIGFKPGGVADGEACDGNVMPDQIAAQREYRARRLREGVFGSELFSDPAWDLLLGLFVARAERRRVSVKSACIAASVPSTTALRHIQHLVDLGLIVRSRHPTDGRSSFLELSDAAKALMGRYFSQVGQTVVQAAGARDKRAESPPSP